MDVSPKDYAATNSSQFSNSNELINRIIEENNEIQFSNIIDIGCGCGNVTYDLFKRIKPQSLLGIDKEPKMIDYAVKHYSAPQIYYEIQDFGVPFHQMNNSLKELSGKTSLIFANESIHWIRDKETAAKNVTQLLADNGKFYANISIIWELSYGMTDEEIDKFGKYVKIPSKYKQCQQWKNAFKSVGMNIIDEKYSESKSFATKDEYINVKIPIIISMFKNYMIVDDPIKQSDICNHYKNFMETKCESLEKICPNSEPNGTIIFELKNRIYQIVAEKISN